MFDRRLITHFNWSLLGVTLFLAITGLINLRSATSSFDLQSQNALFHAQFVWSAIGLLALVIIISIHYRHYQHLAYVIYGFSLFLLLTVLFLGKKVAGHQSWIAFGPFTLQPTEFAKLGLIFALSRHLSTLRNKWGGGFLDLIPSFFLLSLPTVLVILQGDLGSSFFFALIALTLILVFGVRWHVIATVAGIGLIVAVVGHLFFLSPYQKNRIETFLNPELDRKGAGYHLIQSKIAVGSGGFLGKGYLKGQTHKLKFVPERHTDFIFPVLAEEWGFIGGAALLTAYLVFLLLGLNVSLRSGDGFSFFLGIGIVSLFFWHLVINLGGVLGLIPLTGVPLPFFSYGGSSLLTNWMGGALLLNISMRRFMF